MNIEFTLTLSLVTEVEPTADEVQDALASFADWQHLARKLRATAATLCVDALAEDNAVTRKETP